MYGGTASLLQSVYWPIAEGKYGASHKQYGLHSVGAHQADYYVRLKPLKVQ